MGLDLASKFSLIQAKEKSSVSLAHLPCLGDTPDPGGLPVLAVDPVLPRVDAPALVARLGGGTGVPQLRPEHVGPSIRPYPQQKSTMCQFKR